LLEEERNMIDNLKEIRKGTWREERNGG